MTTSSTALNSRGAMILRVTRGKRVSEVQIQTVNEASAWWCAKRDHRNTTVIGASRMPKIEIVVGGEVRGYVSYNGKVWAGRPSDPYQSGQKPIFDPYRHDQ